MPSISLAPTALLLCVLIGGCNSAPIASTAPAAVGEVGMASVRPLPIREAWLSSMTPDDNIDSPASWTAQDGSTWVLATAKSSDQLLVYDGESGTTLQRVGRRGTGEGEFLRPNGIAVSDDLVFVVERDNRRVQVLRLPDFAHVVSFGSETLRKPYGLWVNKVADGYELYVTDAYMAGEDAQGEDILPPLSALDQRVKHFALATDGSGLRPRLVGTFGDTGEQGALRVVESIWGDTDNNRLLIAEEDETYANEFKVYTLAGAFAGRTLGRDVFAAQAEGISLIACRDGSGWWLTTEQGKGQTVFHLFDRLTLQHTGAVTGEKLANTDGIWLHRTPSTRFPQGALYAVHDDQGMVAFDWRDMAKALSLPACPLP